MSVQIKSNPEAPASDYSTFIEELEEAADKLMRQVFEIPSSHSPARVSPKQSSKKVATKSWLQHTTPSPSIKRRSKEYNQQSLQSFGKFIARTDFFQKQKSKKMHQMHRSKEEIVERHHTFHPAINKSSQRLDIKPIQQRSLLIQETKQKKLFEQRACKKMKEQNEINSLTFQPKTNLNYKTQQKSFRDFYEQKVIWDRKKQEDIDKRKHVQEVALHAQCVFKPTLETTKSSFYKKNQRLNQKTKVEDRLLQSLEKSAERRIKI